MLLVARSEMLTRTGLRFDQRFKFHFYDLDFCRQAEIKSISMGTWPISIIHESTGGVGSPAWQSAYEKYLKKYGEQSA